MIFPMSATPLTPLDDALLAAATATGQRCEQAAVGLLVGHRRWLQRADFARFVSHTGDGPDASAVIDWNTLSRPSLLHDPAIEHDARIETADPLPSRSARAILRLACSIASGEPIDLRAALEGLDVTNTVLVLGALNHLAGHAETGEIEVSHGWWA